MQTINRKARKTEALIWALSAARHRDTAHFLAGMGGQNASRKVKRTTDEDAGRRCRQRGLAQGLVERVRGLGRKPSGPGRFGQPVGGDSILLVRNGERHHPAAMPAKLSMKRPTSLVLSMPQTSTSGGSDGLQVGKAWASTRPAEGCALRRATIPHLRNEGPQCTWPQPLHPGRPCGGLLALRNMGIRDAAIAEQPQGGDCIARIVDLMAAAQLRQGQVEQAVLVLEDEPAVLFEGLPVLVGDGHRAAQALGRPHQNLARFIRLDSDHGRPAALQDAGLFRRDQGQRVAQILLVVVVDGGNHRDSRVGDDIGCVQPAAQSNLQQEIVGRNAAEGEKGCRRCDLEKGDGFAAIAASQSSSKAVRSDSAMSSPATRMRS